MKTYLINLDKNVERLAHMTKLLGEKGVEFERIPAVYGAELSREQKRNVFSWVRSLCAVGYRMTPGEIGCALSHLAVYDKVENSACVLEDDISIDGDLGEALNECESFINTEAPRVVLLSGHCFKAFGSERFVRVSFAMCTDAYCINKAAAQLILKANRPVVSVADSWCRWARRYGIEIYHYNPTMVRQANEMFGTDVATVDRSRHGLLLAIWKIVRGLTKFFDQIHYLIFGN